MSRLPEFPEFREIQLDDQELVDPIVRRDHPQASEFSFANMFLWRRTYGFQLAGFDGGIVARGTDRDGTKFFLPPIGVGNVAEAARAAMEIEPGATIRRVPEEIAKTLESAGFEIEADRDNFDYVYRASDLIDLPGRKYHRKKNHLAQFKGKWDYEYRRVTTKELIIGCVDLQHQWCDIRDCFVPENVSLAEEHVAIMDAFDLLKRLQLVAGAILIEGKVVAFCIGGELNPETIVIHFEKADPAYPGLYQVINKEFCADAAREYRYVNREQDLGEPGLRKAKESYYPDHLVEKYIVRRRDS